MSIPADVPIIGSAGQAPKVLIDCPSGLDDGSGRHIAFDAEGNVMLCRPCGGVGKVAIKQDQIGDLSEMIDGVRRMAAQADMVRAQAAAQAEEAGGAGDS